jgi:branched-chain amino acid transport system substrate-binding protein
VLADNTGSGASSNKTLLPGIQAGIALAAREGYKIRYVVADTTSSPAGTLAAAQRLVEEDHVFAVIEGAAFGFAASPFLNSHGIPVIGGANTSEWITDNNMFSVYGGLDTTKPATTVGKFLRMAGATNVGIIAYSLIPNSAATIKAYARSVTAAGLKAGYQNPYLAFGTTNVEPVALAMKSAGIDGFVPFTDPNTGFALETALRQLGVDVKVALLLTGYGGDLLQAGPGALQAGQGVYFLTVFEPVEMHTSATKQFQNMLKSVGVVTEPTASEYDGYASVDLLVRGLKVAGPNPNQAGLISALSTVTDFSAAGLLGSHTLNLGQRIGFTGGPDNCSYVTKLSGSGFALVPGAEPVCGNFISG